MTKRRARSGFSVDHSFEIGDEVLHGNHCGIAATVTALHPMTGRSIGNTVRLGHDMWVDADKCELVSSPVRELARALVREARLKSKLAKAQR